jgi:integrase|uniref:Putative integrase/recombinase protein n=1 Tax=Asterionellopsis glacialis TaxID=33640 RepID=A0A023H9Y7_9STRA|nr:putative integrase/recombinase protein [Asterionellopsis glacialis]AGH28380.1 putative integrase/recombinase protein [Asterionellopsis glacialis]
MENKIQKINKENNSLASTNYEPLRNELSKILENQRISKKKQDQILETTQRGFIGLALRNEDLLKSNQQLKQQLDDVLKELNAVKQEREEKAARREKWAKRKRLPKRDPVNSEIYNLLIKESEGPTYIATRTRIAICLLTVTGIRIGELLSLKVGQLETLVEEGWISIDRLKRGPANHKAFLTSEGKKIVKARKRDFEFLFLMKNKDSYIFTSDRKPNQKLRRETITMDVNKVTHSVSKLLPEKPNITSHSFRIGYISQLWKDTKDIEFVRQTIGHRSLNATSGYVAHMGDEERQNRISSIY